jgi:hypothetical protein
LLPDGGCTEKQGAEEAGHQAAIGYRTENLVQGQLGADSGGPSAGRGNEPKEVGSRSTFPEQYVPSGKEALNGGKACFCVASEGDR